MARATQFTLSHENRPGALAHIAKVLGDAKVNILACLTTASGNEGLTRLIVDRADKAKKPLATAGLATPKRMCFALNFQTHPEHWQVTKISFK